MLNGESWEDSIELAKGKIKGIMFTAWKFWPLVHCVTYSAIPARHRILWVNCVDLFWNAILASMASGSDDDDDDNNKDGNKIDGENNINNGIGDTAMAIDSIAVPEKDKMIESSSSLLLLEVNNKNGNSNVNTSDNVNVDVIMVEPEMKRDRDVLSDDLFFIRSPTNNSNTTPTNNEKESEINSEMYHQQ